jgi:hypothetical protein
VVVDSNSKKALTASGNASTKAASIQVVGGVSLTGNATLSPAAATGAASVPDPLAGLTGPSPTELTNYGSVSLSGKNTATLNPGIYSQISASGNASLTLNPGVYLIEGGGFTVTGNASVSGTGVLLYNTGSNYPSAGGTYGGLTLSGNGSFSLTAATSGPYAGVVIFEARANTRALAFSGNGATGITGTVYAPAAQVLVSGNAKLTGSLVANELSLSGNGVSTQAADGASGSALDTASAGTLVAGNLAVYVSDPAGLFTAAEQARIQDAITAWDNLLVPYSVMITEVSDPTLANVILDTGTTSAAGSAAAGVLGCYTSTGEITLLQGWNWYDGSDPTQIGTGQYDFQTVVTHELGHALGLGGSSDPTSPMYEILASGAVRRTPTTADLNIPDPPAGADAEWAAPRLALATPVTLRDAGAGKLPAAVVSGLPSDGTSRLAMAPQSVVFVVSGPRESFAAAAMGGTEAVQGSGGAIATAPLVATAMPPVCGVANLLLNIRADSGGNATEPLPADEGGWPGWSQDEPAALPVPSSPEAIHQILDQAGEFRWAPGADLSLPTGGVRSAAAVEAVFSGGGADPQPLQICETRIQPLTAAPTASEPSVAWAGLLAILWGAELPTRKTGRRPGRATPRACLQGAPTEG